ncbi:hypothetical protein [uncultured Lentibacter sp.]|nr:hypothetical protein [uncultured Lentibacter sp.]
MMRCLFVALACGCLAGCGANGAPERPQGASGVSVTGYATVGVVKN